MFTPRIYVSQFLFEITHQQPSVFSPLSENIRRLQSVTRPLSIDTVYLSSLFQLYNLNLRIYPRFRTILLL